MLTGGPPQRGARGWAPPYSPAMASQVATTAAFAPVVAQVAQQRAAARPAARPAVQVRPCATGRQGRACSRGIGPHPLPTCLFACSGRACGLVWRHPRHPSVRLRALGASRVSCSLQMAWGSGSEVYAAQCRRSERRPGVPTMAMPTPAPCAAGPAQPLPELITKETVRALEVRTGSGRCRAAGGAAPVPRCRHGPMCSACWLAIQDALSSCMSSRTNEHGGCDASERPAPLLPCRPSWTMARPWLRCAASTTTWPRCPPSPGVSRPGCCWAGHGRDARSCCTVQRVQPCAACMPAVLPLLLWLPA